MEFLESKTGQISAKTYFLSITEILNSVHQIGNGVPLIFDNCIFIQLI